MVLGSVAVFADKHDRYTEEHARLFSLLKEPFSIAIYNTEIYREVLRLRDMLIDDNKFLHRELYRISGERIIGEEFGLGPVMEMVRQVAPSESPVLLLGETGTGKDIIANAVHQASERRNGPFIAVNCGAIPETLIDSELFGHEKGSFTGALSQKRGRFERADKGTIFLDEIGEMPPSAQVRLLRVLQNKEIERVGGVTPIPLDIRIIAATNRNLDKMVEENQFRQDLMFRLNVFPITIPPLRERIGDIPALAQYFLQKKIRELKIQRTPKLADKALEQLEFYDWPGNVRELENVIERALLLNPEGPLEFSHIVSIDRGRNKKGTLKKNYVSMRLDDVLSNHIRLVLQHVNGKVHGPGGAAEILGVNPSTLRGKMRKLGISYGRNK
jgi:transcriptional regulator with GAF, ATPase, and Fis domain